MLLLSFLMWGSSVFAESNGGGTQASLLTHSTHHHSVLIQKLRRHSLRTPASLSYLGSRKPIWSDPFLSNLFLGEAGRTRANLSLKDPDGDRAEKDGSIYSPYSLYSNQSIFRLEHPALSIEERPSYIAPEGALLTF